MNANKPEPILLLSCARGVYIPRDFINEVKPECLSGVSPDTAATLRAGPDTDGYWDAWVELEQSAVVTNLTTGVRYSVYQDGDCWLIPDGMPWDEENEFYSWDAQS